MPNGNLRRLEYQQDAWQERTRERCESSGYYAAYAAAHALTVRIEEEFESMEKKLQTYPFTLTDALLDNYDGLAQIEAGEIVNTLSEDKVMKNVIQGRMYLGALIDTTDREKDVHGVDKLYIDTITGSVVGKIGGYKAIIPLNKDMVNAINEALSARYQKQRDAADKFIAVAAHLERSIIKNNSTKHAG